MAFNKCASTGNNEEIEYPFPTAPRGGLSCRATHAKSNVDLMSHHTSFKFVEDMFPLMDPISDYSEDTTVDLAPMVPLPESPILTISTTNESQEVIPIQFLIESELTLSAEQIQSGRNPEIFTVRGTITEATMREMEEDNTVFHRSYSIPYGIMKNYRFFQMKQIPDSRSEEAWIAWRSHQIIRDFYRKHQRVFDKFIKGTAPFQGQYSWEKHFCGSDEEGSDDTDVSDSIETLSIPSYSRSVFSSYSLSLSLDDEPIAQKIEKKMATKTKHRIRIKYEGMSPSQMEDKTSPSFHVSMEDTENPHTKIYKSPKPLALGLEHLKNGNNKASSISFNKGSKNKQFSTLFKHMNSFFLNITSRATPPVGTPRELPPATPRDPPNTSTSLEISDRNHNTLVREAWRVWALRRGIKPTLGIFSRPKIDEYILLTAFKGSDIPYTNTTNENGRKERSELDMATFIKNCPHFYLQESYVVLGMTYKDLRISRMIAMLVLTVNALHREGIAHGGFDKFGHSISLVFNDVSGSYYPVVTDFTGAAVAEEAEREGFRDGTGFIGFDASYDTVFTTIALKDWRDIAKLIAAMFMGMEWFDANFREKPAMTRSRSFHKVDESKRNIKDGGQLDRYFDEMRRAGVPAAAVQFMGRLSKSPRIRGEHLLRDPWLVEMDWQKVIEGIH